MDNDFKNFGKRERISKTVLSNITDYMKTSEGYIFFCKYDGLNYPKCFNNYKGICRTVYLFFPFNLLHSFDKRNIIKCVCG